MKFNLKQQTTMKKLDSVINNTIKVRNSLWTGKMPELEDVKLSNTICAMETIWNILYLNGGFMSVREIINEASTLNVTSPINYNRKAHSHPYWKLCSTLAQQGYLKVEKKFKITGDGSYKMLNCYAIADIISPSVQSVIRENYNFNVIDTKMINNMRKKKGMKPIQNEWFV